MKSIRQLIREHGIPEEIPVRKIHEELIFIDRLNSFKHVEGYAEKVNGVLMNPFKLDYFCICLCVGGSLSYMSDLQTWHLEKNCCIVLPPNSIGQLVDYSEDVRIIGIACGRDFYPTEIAGVDSNFPMEILQYPMFRISDFDVSNTVTIMKLIAEMHRTGTVPESIIKQQLAVLFNLLMHIIRSSPSSQRSKQGETVKAFFNLLSSNVKKQRRMTYYAEKLNITPKYLSAVLKQFTGLSAAGWIRERIIQEAKILLLSNKYTVWQISEILGFPNESFFGTYFKKSTGCTPAEFARINQSE